MKLDAKTIGGLRLLEGKNDHIFWDDRVVGFGVRLRRMTGDEVAKAYIYQYRHHGKSRRFLIARVGDITPAAALDMAKDLRARVRLGQDPQAEREQRRAENQKRDRPFMFATIVGPAPEPRNEDDPITYLDARKTKVRPRSYEEIARYLTGRSFARLHKMDIGEITKRDVALALNSIPQYVTAKCARTTLNKFYIWCMQQGLADHNPVVDTAVEEPADHEARGRVLKVEELGQIWRALDADDGEFAAIVKLLILLGCRRKEIGGMCWSEFTPDRVAWTLPKARAKNNNALTLELPPLARDIIRAIPERVGRDQLFGLRGTGFSGWGRAKKRLDAKVKLAPWRIHDLRKSTATGMANLGGIPPHVVEAILNHISGSKAGVAGLYNKSDYAAETRLALRRWADHITSVVHGEPRKVVQFQAASA
jgi:integrase